MRPGDGHPLSENMWSIQIGAFKCHLNAPIWTANKKYALFPFSSLLEEGGRTSGFWDGEGGIYFDLFSLRSLIALRSVCLPPLIGALERYLEWNVDAVNMGGS